MRAIGALVLGLALGGVAAVFDTASLYVPAVALGLLAVGCGLWVLLAAAGAGIDREAGPPTVLEDQPYAIRLLVRSGWLPTPGGVLDDPLLDEPIGIGGISARTMKIEVRFPRRGRRTIGPGRLTINDPLRLATRTVRADGEQSELLVLPRIEPVTAPGGSGAGGRGGGPDGRAQAALARGRRDGSAAELDLDGLRPYRTGTPASRIHWPAVARSGEMVERRLVAESDSAPLVVLDSTAPPSDDALDAAVRAAASLCMHLARRGGCALLLPGERRPVTVAPDLAGWPALHARLALVAPARSRPSLTGARRAGAVLWVSARPDAPRDLARTTAAAGWLVTPLAGDEAADASFLVAGCAGRRVTRRATAGTRVAA